MSPLYGERPEDILLLAETFLPALRAQARPKNPRFSDNAAAALLAYPWPGNVPRTAKTRSSAPSSFQKMDGHLRRRARLAGVYSSSPGASLAPASVPTGPTARPYAPPAEPSPAELVPIRQYPIRNHEPVATGVATGRRTATPAPGSAGRHRAARRTRKTGHPLRLRNTGGNRTKTADLLKISITHLAQTTPGIPRFRRFYGRRRVRELSRSLHAAARCGLAIK